MVKVKICGITNLEDALAALQMGADALGFVFVSESPRHVSPERAARIIEKLPPFMITVGVFVNAPWGAVEGVQREAGLTLVQFHGEEPPETCRKAVRAIKALRVQSSEDIATLANYPGLSAYLLDAYTPGAHGGTGVTFNWDLAIEAKQYGRVILAGGLTPDNVEAAVRHVRPYGVDVSSGVEAHKGIKDHAKMRAFIERVKGA